MDSSRACHTRRSPVSRASGRTGSPTRGASVRDSRCSPRCAATGSATAEPEEDPHIERQLRTRSNEMPRGSRLILRRGGPWHSVSLRACWLVPSHPGGWRPGKGGRGGAGHRSAESGPRSGTAWGDDARVAAVHRREPRPEGTRAAAERRGLGHRHPRARRGRGGRRALLAAGCRLGAKSDDPDSQWAAIRAASWTTTEQATVEAIIAASRKGRDG